MIALRVIVDDRTYQQLLAASRDIHGQEPGMAERERRIEMLAENAVSEVALGWWNSRGQPELPAMPDDRVTV